MLRGLYAGTRGRSTLTEFEPLRTERATLRTMTLDDVDAVHAYQSDPEVCRYQLYEPRTRAEVEDKIGTWMHRRTLAEDGDDLELAIDVDGVGLVGHAYFKLVSVADLTAELGWALHRDHQGKGLRDGGGQRAPRLLRSARSGSTG